MNEEYAEIKAELELTKQELLTRLTTLTDYEVSNEFHFDWNKKEKVLLTTIKEDLEDVERALAKMDFGVYGICEDTGESIPIERLKILPTARTKDDFVFNDLFEKSVVPQYQSYHFSP